VTSPILCIWTATHTQFLRWASFLMSLLGLVFCWAAARIGLLLTSTGFGKITLSSRWYFCCSMFQSSQLVSLRASPFHWTKTIWLGGSVVVSSFWLIIASGSTKGWFWTTDGGRSLEVVTGPWCGLRSEQWKTGWILDCGCTSRR